MNTTTRIPKLFLTAQTVNPPRFPLHVPNESIADKHPINIKIFCRKLRFRCQRTLCIMFRIQDQVHSSMAALTCLRSVETNLTLTCPSPKSFVCKLPDSGRHVTSVFQGLSLLLRRAGRREPWEQGWHDQSDTLFKVSPGLFLTRLGTTWVRFLDAMIEMSGYQN